MMIIFYQIIFQKYSGEIISPFRPIFSPQNIAKNSYKYCTTIPTFFQRKNMNIAANLRTSYSGALVGFSLLTASQILKGDRSWSPFAIFVLFLELKHPIASILKKRFDSMSSSFGEHLQRFYIKMFPKFFSVVTHSTPFFFSPSPL